MEEVGAALGPRSARRAPLPGPARTAWSDGASPAASTRARPSRAYEASSQARSPRFGQRRLVRQGAGEIFAQSGADLTGEGARLVQLVVEVVGVVGQAEGFELGGTARLVFTDQHEVARVRHQNQPVAAPIAADLSGVRGEPSIVIDGLHLDHATLRRLAVARPAFLHLPRRVEAEVGMPGALVDKLADAKHLGFEPRTHGVQ